MAFNKKRDRIQIVADILSSCRRPQTQTFIRRQTNISYAILQSCITELLLRRWLSEVNENSGQKKLAITDKGLVFLNKWFELQKMVETKNMQKPKIPTAEIQSITVRSE